MAKRFSDNRLNRLAKATKDTLASWKEGVSIERDSRKSIDALVLQTARDRWKLAEGFRQQGKALLRRRPTYYRSAISRFYYSIYHAFRACAFLAHGGDDYEAHSELLKNLPSDLPTGPNWPNILKTYRLLRNSADYDPYPRQNSKWLPLLGNIEPDSEMVLKMAKNYLIGKGCVL